MDCPCASNKAFSACCEPHIKGAAKPPTAEALMRSRYAAYAVGAVDYIGKTQAPESNHDFDPAAAKKWSEESTWDGLEIVATKKGREGDAEGVVSFIARYSKGEERFEHHEISTFRRDGEQWLFVAGKAPIPDTVVHDKPAPGRNAPCACGSGKKYKKCCGR